MDILIKLIPLIIVLPLIALWAWMFQDMMKNSNIPSVVKPYWTMAFILLSVATAVFYYMTEYRDRK